jgi:hypothetical protein
MEKAQMVQNNAMGKNAHQELARVTLPPSTFDEIESPISTTIFSSAAP